MKRLLPICTLAFLFGALTSPTAVQAEPFEIEDMPAEFDGVKHPWSDARRPVGIDLNGDGQDSWYAGGNRVAHPKQPTPLDPLRFVTQALPAITLPACSSCTPVGNAFAVADFNSDGKPDIARIVEWNGQTGAYTLQLYLGNGNEGFTLGDRRDWNDPIMNSLGYHTYQMRAADLDSDGDADLAILSTYEFTDYEADPHMNRGNLKVRWNSIGSFASESTIQSLRFDDISRLVVGDFDRDADVDMIVNFQTTWNGTQSYTAISRLFTNGGSGNFTGTSDSGFDAQFFHYPMFFADLDRNGWPEFVTYSGQFFVRKYDPSNGWGGFSSYGALQSPAFSDQLPVVAADFNEDGRIDIVAADGAEGGNLRNLVLLRTGLVGAAESTTVLTTFASNITHIGVGDARGDADQDILVRLANGSFKFLRNTAQRLATEFGAETQTTALTGLTRLGSADANRDGIADLFALRPASSGSHMERVLGNGNNQTGFGAAEFKILANTPSDFALGDFNEDDRVDYAYVVPNANAVRTVLQNDSLFFGWTDTKIADYAGAALIEAGNLVNSDERTDLVVGSNSTGGLLALRNGNASWSDSNPRTSFGLLPNALVMLPHYLGIADSPTTCGADGISFQAHAYTASLGWGQTAQLVQVQNVGQTGVCAAINLDHDATLELVFVTGQGDLAWWNPTNTPASPYTVIQQVPSAVNAIAATDWNRDGLDDLLLATSTGVYLYTREGLNEAWSRRRLSSVEARDVVAIDIDRDSRPDAAFLTAQGISMSLNISRIALSGDVSYPGGLPVVLSPGQSGFAFAGEVKNPGRFDEDASIAITGAKVYFKKVVYNGNVWTPGVAMTRSEVEQAVASVSILMDGAVIGTTGTSIVAGDGSLQINYVPGFGNVVPIAADSSKVLQFRVNLKPTAGSASYSEFMLVATGNTARVLHGNNPIGLTGSVGPAPYNLIRISQDLFANGFE